MLEGLLRSECNGVSCIFLRLLLAVLAISWRQRLLLHTPARYYLFYSVDFVAFIARELAKQQEIISCNTISLAICSFPSFAVLWQVLDHTTYASFMIICCYSPACSFIHIDFRPLLLELSRSKAFPQIILLLW